MFLTLWHVKIQCIHPRTKALRFRGCFVLADCRERAIERAAEKISWETFKVLLCEPITYSEFGRRCKQSLAAVLSFQGLADWRDSQAKLRKIALEVAAEAESTSERFAIWSVRTGLGLPAFHEFVKDAEELDLLGV